MNGEKFVSFVRGNVTAIFPDGFLVKDQETGKHIKLFFSADVNQERPLVNEIMRQALPFVFLHDNMRVLGIVGAEAFDEMAAAGEMDMRPGLHELPPSVKH